MYLGAPCHASPAQHFRESIAVARQPHWFPVTMLAVSQPAGSSSVSMPVLLIKGDRVPRPCSQSPVGLSGTDAPQLVVHHCAGAAARAAATISPLEAPLYSLPPVPPVKAHSEYDARRSRTNSSQQRHTEGEQQRI